MELLLSSKNETICSQRERIKALEEDKADLKLDKQALNQDKSELRADKEDLKVQLLNFGNRGLLWCHNAFFFGWLTFFDLNFAYIPYDSFVHGHGLFV